MKTIIKVAQKGRDVKTCSDSQLLFSSDIPSLQIVKEGYLTLDGSGTNFVISHDLGFFPYIESYYSISGKWEAGGAISKENTIEVYNSLSGEVCHYIIYNYNIEQNYTGLIDNTTFESDNNNRDWGIKVSDRKGSLEDVDISKLSLSSNGKINRVFKSGTFSSSIYIAEYQIVHNLGYAPEFALFGQYNNSGFYYRIDYIGGMIDPNNTDYNRYSSHYSDSSVITTTVWENMKIAYVILRDSIQ